MSTTTIPIIPITASPDGRRNAFTHGCKHVGQTRHYASCLHISNPDSEKSEYFQTLYSDCIQAVRKGLCPAVDMRNKEIEAGKALYFKERVVYMGQKLIDAAVDVFGFSRSPATVENATMKVMKNRPSKTVKDKSPVSSKKADEVDMGTYADALNNAQAKAVETQSVVVVATQNQPSSLMEMAKQMLAQKGNK